jgi:hypothetical protein
MQSMTIGAALRRIKKLKGVLAQARAELNAGNVWFEVEPPGIRAEVWQGEAEQARDELVKLSALVAEANATTKLGSGASMAFAIREMAEIKSEIAWLKPLKSMPLKQQVRQIEKKAGYGATVGPPPVAMTVHCLLTVPEIRARVQELETRFEQLNNEVEALNHKTLIQA